MRWLSKADRRVYIISAFNKAEQTCPNRYVRIPYLHYHRYIFILAISKYWYKHVQQHVHKTLTVFKNSILYLKYVRLNTCISSIQDLKARLIDTSIHHLDLTPALYSSRVMQMVVPKSMDLAPTVFGSWYSYHT